MIAGSSWDERWSNDLAVKTVTSEDSLKNKTGTGSFVTGSNRAFVREPAKQPTDLHQIRRKLDDLDALAFAWDDSCGNTISMDIHTNIRSRLHSWSPS
jgi:hypothetical protein